MKLSSLLALGWLAGAALVLADDAVDAFTTWRDASRDARRNLESCPTGPTNTFLTANEDCRLPYRTEQWLQDAADSRRRLIVLAAYVALPPALIVGAAAIATRRRYPGGSP